MGKLMTKGEPPNTTMWKRVDGEDAPDELIQHSAGEEVDCEDWLIRNLPSTPAFRCLACGRKGGDCCSATFMRPEGPSPAYCMDCLWALAVKHLTPLEDVTNG